MVSRRTRRDELSLGVGIAAGCMGIPVSAKAGVLPPARRPAVVAKAKREKYDMKDIVIHVGIHVKKGALPGALSRLLYGKRRIA
jgi:hypothetical protein